MQRHMQNISFLVIVAVLLSCAFFISQQTKPGTPENGLTATTPANIETRNDIPLCDEDLSESDTAKCYQEASDLSGRLVDAKVDEILNYETDSNRRMTFMDVQIAWEESRDAECAYVGEMASATKGEAYAEAICLRDHNLARLDQLDQYLCDWYDASKCSGAVSILDN